MEMDESVLKALLAGGLAGMAGKSVVAPLDRVKILFQTQSVSYRNLGILASLGRCHFLCDKYIGT